VLTLLLRNTQNNFAYACCFLCCAKAWLGYAKPSHSAAELLFCIKVTSQQGLGFFGTKNPSTAQVDGHEAVAEVYVDASAIKA
jgi:hypothetical protein